MLTRVLEPEVMDCAEEARDYDAMDHAAVNRAFVADFAAAASRSAEDRIANVLDLGTGTAQIPLELCRATANIRITAVDLAAEMLRLAERNVARAGLAARIELQRVDAKQLPYPDGQFDAVISNSIVHHIAEPAGVLAEAVRVVRSGGLLFVRDLLRPDDDATVRRLVDTYAADANQHQRAMFDASLRAALSLEEIRAIVRSLGFAAETVRATSDRHWTWDSERGAGIIKNDSPPPLITSVYTA